MKNSLICEFTKDIVKEGDITLKDYEKHVKSLPDVSDKATFPYNRRRRRKQESKKNNGTLGIQGSLDRRAC